ncbi:RNA-binding protein [Thioalkalivibrio sp. ALE21]|uniref:ribosome assembly RNA-binding protein YhbY n=1 Tax=Thioalkalivibrio sp. ALE21 TaxID=1158175 RepID=UPI000D911721|nr:ribosome assembly RNA-binding protein YhbY [Thioalkalivibrio sp. ALE21]PYG02644.1 RNA-binding protein [Thioalkalivibrio sp. ALE21]
MNLTDAERRHLRSLAHPRKPVVTLGRHGLSEAVLAELEQALAHHELVKVKVGIGDRDARAEVIHDMCERTGAELVQRIGHVATLFRRNPEAPKVSLEPVS